MAKLLNTQILGNLEVYGTQVNDSYYISPTTVVNKNTKEESSVSERTDISYMKIGTGNKISFVAPYIEFTELKNNVKSGFGVTTIELNNKTHELPQNNIFYLGARTIEDNEGTEINTISTSWAYKKDKQTGADDTTAIDQILNVPGGVIAQTSDILESLKVDWDEAKRQGTLIDSNDENYKTITTYGTVSVKSPDPDENKKTAFLEVEGDVKVHGKLLDTTGNEIGSKVYIANINNTADTTTDTTVISNTIGSNPAPTGTIVIINRKKDWTNDYLRTAYVNNGTNTDRSWAAFNGNYSAKNVFFEDDLKITKTLGKHEPDNTGSKTLSYKGMSIEDIFNDAFRESDVNRSGWTLPTLNITTSNPSIGGTLLGEAGSSYDPSITVSVKNTPSYSYGTSTQKDPSLSYTLKINESTINSNTTSKTLTTNKTELLSGTFAEGTTHTKTFNVSVDYTASKYALDNLGVTSTTEKMDGTVSESATVYFKGFRYSYFGTDASDDAFFKNINNMTTNTTFTQDLDANDIIRIAYRSGKSFTIKVKDDFKGEYVTAEEDVGIDTQSTTTKYLIPEHSRPTNGTILTSTNSTANAYTYKVIKIKKDGNYQLKIS